MTNRAIFRAITNYFHFLFGQKNVSFLYLQIIMFSRFVWSPSNVTTYVYLSSFSSKKQRIVLLGSFNVSLFPSITMKCAFPSTLSFRSFLSLIMIFLFRMLDVYNGYNLFLFIYPF